MYRLRTGYMKILVFIFIILILLLPACNGASVLKEVGQDVILYPQTESVLEFNEVESAVKQKVEIQDFCKQFDITQYKTYQYKTRQSIAYVVCKTTDGPYLIFFDSVDPNCTMERISFSSTDSQSIVDKLQPGMMLRDVQLADPEGQFHYVYASFSGNKQYSCHYFETGECYYILYSGGVIEEIINFTI